MKIKEVHEYKTKAGKLKQKFYIGKKKNCVMEVPVV